MIKLVQNAGIKVKYGMREEKRLERFSASVANVHNILW